ncbi:hypothetical protein DS2_09852 [Catenovulum agarivorans DS-2]|uniref:Uncharacterized protein n=1 Tax=Catenovulum agarivorans DS-2 TaxID=1328313 RepID=W7QMC2_9ALTE|nr:hypothetical protein [Catenovulum agarivorans]EWH10087.1 hypothetical protein DS2_09852 [Catenovulum agarivorans DS-2]
MKKLKAIFIVIMGACVSLLLYQLWPNDPTTEQGSPVTNKQLEPAATPEIERLPTQQVQQAQQSDTHSASDTMLKQQAAAKQAEIEVLMAELDSNLSDKYKKQQIEQQLHQKLAEYNELVLPIALQQMQQRNEQNNIQQAN